MSAQVFADNCQVCGEEKLSIELMPVRLGEHSFSRIKTCLGCLIEHKDIQAEFKEAANLIVKAMREELIK